MSNQRPQNANLIPAKKGEVRNPNGRPKGSRNKLGEQFLSDLYEDWKEHGPSALEACRLSKPEAYVKTVASILPKIVKVEDAADLTDEQLVERIRQLSTLLAISDGDAAGTGGTADGTEPPSRPH